MHPVFIAIGIVILLCLIYELIIKYKKNKINKIDYKSYKPKTGDIIFTRHCWLDYGEVIHYVMYNVVPYYLFNSIFGHAGFVLYYNNKPCIFQVNYAPSYCEYRKKYVKASPVIMNLENYIQEYNGEVYVCSIKNEIDNDIVNKNVSYFINNYKQEINQLVWLNSILEFDMFNNEKKQFCSQLVANMLNKSNILSLTKDSRYYDPEELYYTCINSKKYNDMVIIINIFLQDSD
jgi:hypothetical protein